MKVTVLGSGQWGSAIAQILCDAGNDVLIWGRNQTYCSGKPVFLRKYPLFQR